MTTEPTLADGSDDAPAPWVFDVLLGIGVALVVSMFIAADIQGSEPAAWAYLWAIGLGGLMLVRRRYPVIVLVLSAAAVLSYYAAGYPAIGVAVPLAAAVFTAAERKRVAAAIATSAAILTISVVYRLAEGQDPALVVGFDLPGHALLFAAAIAFGDSLRARRELRAKSMEVATLLAENLAREAEKRTAEERLALARELHDSVGHALTVVSLHTQIAQEALQAGDISAHQDAPAIREALEVVSAKTTATFDDLRRTVSSLRRGSPGTGTAFQVADLEAAVLPARQAGIEVATAVALHTRLPPTVQSTIYRIVQEAVTNIVRHSAAASAEVDVRQHDGHIHITVINDGVTPGSVDERQLKSGSGLPGMRERVALLGGTFAAGPDGEDRFAVRASLPVEGTS